MKKEFKSPALELRSDMFRSIWIQIQNLDLNPDLGSASRIRIRILNPDPNPDPESVRKITSPPKEVWVDVSTL